MRFQFYVVSKDDSHMLTDAEFQLNSQAADWKFITNNTTPLPKLYNELLSFERMNDLPHDVVAFMHADVKLDVGKLMQNVAACSEKYDVMGLCGTEVLNVSQSPLNWFTGSRLSPEKRWGCVTHGEIGNHMTYFSAHSPSVLDHEVVCIDGLCIVFVKKALNSNLKFDEKFLFDQYDTDLSLQCVMNYHFKLGVLVHTELQHYSVGKGILTEQFLAHEKDLREKWNFNLVK